MTDCIFIKETPVKAVCQLCGAVIKTEFPPEKIHRKCTKETQNKKGPGSDLRAILKAMGFTYKFKCGCDDFVRLMNYHGLEWCKANKDFIAQRLTANAKARGHSKLINNPMTVGALLKFSFAVSTLKITH